MNELLLQAERTLAAGLPVVAERLYRQALADDPTSPIALMGLARVAIEQGDDVAAFRFARRALAADPAHEPAARLASRLDEIHRYRGQDIEAMAAAAEAAETTAAAEAADAADREAGA